MKIALYMHGGSGNHGCEALVRTICALMPKNTEIKVFSKNPEEDKKYIGDKIDVVLCGQPLSKKTFKGFLTALKIKVFKKKLSYVKPAYDSLLKYADKNTIAISIGGDNYCYDGMPEVLALLNKMLRRKGAKTVLLGCSIEPELLKDANVIKDLSNYDLITARETITYEAIKSSGVKSKVLLIPDSAFTLPTVKKEGSEDFPNQTVGLNISPLVLSCETGEPILFNAYCKLIEYIIENSSMDIALIPHVVWAGNNDNLPINKLYEKYKETGRIIKIEDCNATELKGYISKCRFFVGARTHATIAAYSSCVPTLVIGYSVKSRGIAKDLFGTDENYVRSVSTITEQTALINSFKWLQENEYNIKKHLLGFMPEYINRTKEVQKVIEKLLK